MNDLSITAVLLSKINDGDETAKNDLAVHCYPMILKWAHGRIPYSETSLLDTTDLVQETFIRALKRINQFESLKPGAFLAYLRKIFINCVRDAAKKAQSTDDIENYLNSNTKFAHEIDLDDFIVYEKALEKLNKVDQEAIILRMEFGFSYAEIAEAMDKPSPDAARMHVNRALVKLSEIIE
ncbi:RNA polymerase sigma factor [Marinicella sp. W31]|uniref:RNA polymerase sigma factor n=1 Tax=Marinicella sp. W31 TaxID=3023713 RepID=UPI003756CCBD